MRRGSNNRETPKGVPSSKNNRQLVTCRPFRDTCMRTKSNSYRHGSYRLGRVYRQGSKTLFHAYGPWWAGLAVSNPRHTHCGLPLMAFLELHVTPLWPERNQPVVSGHAANSSPKAAVRVRTAKQEQLPGVLLATPPLRWLSARARMHGKGFCYPADKPYPGFCYPADKPYPGFCYPADKPYPGFCYPAGKPYPGGSYRGGKNLVWSACMSHGRAGR